MRFLRCESRDSQKPQDTANFGYVFLPHNIHYATNGYEEEDLDNAFGLPPFFKFRA